MSKTFLRAAKGLLVLELAAVAGAYGLFHGLVWRCFQHRASYPHILHAKRKHTTTNFCVCQVDAADTPLIPFQVCLFVCVCVRACACVYVFCTASTPRLRSACSAQSMHPLLSAASIKSPMASTPESPTWPGARAPDHTAI